MNLTKHHPAILKSVATRLLLLLVGWKTAKSARKTDRKASFVVFRVEDVRQQPRSLLFLLLLSQFDQDLSFKFLVVALDHMWLVPILG